MRMETRLSRIGSSDRIAAPTRPHRYYPGQLWRGQRDGCDPNSARQLRWICFVKTTATHATRRPLKLVGPRLRKLPENTKTSLGRLDTLVKKESGRAARASEVIPCPAMTSAHGEDVKRLSLDHQESMTADCSLCHGRLITQNKGDTMNSKRRAVLKLQRWSRSWRVPAC